MSASRLLVDVISEWRTCEDMSSASASLVAKKPQRRTEKDKRASALQETIEGEVIPRLMLSHSQHSDTSILRASSLNKPTTADIAELARLALEHDVKVAHAFINTLVQRGVTIEAVFTELLAPAAKLLGEMWRLDLCDFTDVTVGLSRLQHLLHEFSPAFEGEMAAEFNGRRVLLLPAVGEQHTLGLMIVDEFFRRAGWDCCTAIPETPAHMLNLVKHEHFDVVGFSASSDAMLGTLYTAIKSVRKASINRNLVVVVGGPVFLDNPEFVSRVGADGTAKDGREAVLQLRSLFDTSTIKRESE